MREGRKAADLVTFGCRLNLYESEAMRELAAKAGLLDVVIFNTCSVTAEAERQSRQAIRKARRERPDSLILVTGCAAQIAPEKFAAMEEVDFVIGNEAKMKAETFVEIARLCSSASSPDSFSSSSPNFSPSSSPRKRGSSGPASAGRMSLMPRRRAALDSRFRGNDTLGDDLQPQPKPQTQTLLFYTDISAAQEAPSPLVHGFAGGLTRGFVQVQNGCDHACTYCVIPQGRGPSRSVPLATIVEQTRLLLAEGYPEIALTGVDITAYGGDFSETQTQVAGMTEEGRLTLGQMVRDLLMQVPELKRLRLSSLDPVEVDDDLWALLETEPRLMPHLHLSLQAGDDMVLKRMKRRHTRQDIYDFVARARAARPDIAFGADLIAGFPTETDEMFENTCRLLEDLDFTWLHVFPYSARQGTPAAKMPQVPMAVRKARAAKLREIGARAVHRHLDRLIGQKIEVHVEQPTLARTPSFAEVTLLSPADVGSVILVQGVRREGERLVAEKVEQ